ncbi:MAG: cytochrome c biogenesis protein CcdA [Elusimicrobiota bacterium]|nr:sulfite exporter TauE/SafE family protein [Endomicrobiia bacterium]MDW8165694.1 cytochrome c biogenesis protein CcdA [Elusimicrobiota bacterium]
MEITLIGAYLAGVATSFTPCVYPLIPIVVAYIGAQSEASVGKRVVLTLIFVLGVSITYSLLGGLASISGSVFGLIQNSFWTNLVVAFVCLVFSFSMFGIFKINFNLQGIINPSIFKGYLGSLVLGATSGLVFSPCSTPVLGTILVIVATQQKLFEGMILLFVFSLGLSTTLLVAGIFSGIATKLPKPGRWSIVIEKIFALVLLAVSIYYFYRAFVILI